jgi:hypothetical protein
MNRISSKKIFVNKIIIAIILVVFILQGKVNSQSIPFNSARWEFDAGEYKIGNYFGKEGVFLKDGSAIVKDSEFKNGIIEFDIAVTDKRGFMGVVWRIQDDNNYEEWMHIKLVIVDQQAEVYINDMGNPALFIPELKREQASGKVGINVSSGFAPAYFSNFSYEKIERPKIKSKPMEKKTVDAGTVMSWQVSNTFDAEWLNDRYDISRKDIENLNWTKLNSENTGITNLARVQGISEKHNTAFAKLVVNSDKEQVKKIKFGYSDNVKVYVNGKLIYGGTNFYSSRDYRYLGTIGLFDEVYLHLQEGENEILLAVTENFGGWGIVAAFNDLDQIKLVD